MRLIRLAVVLALAQPALAHAIDRASPFSPGHRTLGQATLLIVQGRYVEAEPILREALAIDPMLVEAHYNRGVVLRHLGHPAEAIDELRVALSLYAPNDESNRAKCLYGIAFAAEDTGDTQAATQAWRDYIAFDQKFSPSDPVLEIARAHLDYEKALARQERLKIPGTQKATR